MYDKASPEFVLDGVTVAIMARVMTQLGELSEFAVDIVQRLLESAKATNDRLGRVTSRISTLEKVMPEVEVAFDQLEPKLFTTSAAGNEWRRPENPGANSLFTRDTCPFSMQKRRLAAKPMPDFSVMNQFAKSGSGDCTKEYSNPNFFVEQWIVVEKERQKKALKERAERRRRRKELKKKKLMEQAATEKKVVKEVARPKYAAMGKEFTQEEEAKVTEHMMRVKSQAVADAEKAQQEALKKVSELEEQHRQLAAQYDKLQQEAQSAIADQERKAQAAAAAEAAAKAAAEAERATQAAQAAAQQAVAEAKQAQEQQEAARQAAAARQEAMKDAGKQVAKVNIKKDDVEIQQAVNIEVEEDTAAAPPPPPPPPPMLDAALPAIVNISADAPPPPPSSSAAMNAKGGGLMDELKKGGVALKHVDKANAPVVAKSLDSRDAMLLAIRSGQQLKHVRVDQRKKDRAPMEQAVLDILQRRGAIAEESDEEHSGISEDDQTWETDKEKK